MTSANKRELCLSVDVNECERNLSQCHVNGNCTNTEGSYTCECNDGFEGDGTNCTGMYARISASTWHHYCVCTLKMSMSAWNFLAMSLPTAQILRALSCVHALQDFKAME